MPITTGFEFGEVVLVRFPFTDQVGQKQRPAVVISTAAYQRQRPDVILMAIISQLRPTALGEALVQDWQGAGLLKPSAIKPVIFTAEKTLIRKSLGRLQAVDQQALRRVIETVIG